MGFSKQEYWSGLSFPSPVDHILSELSTMTRPFWVALQGMAHSFIELDKAVLHVIRLVSFRWLWFAVCLPSDGEGFLYTFTYLFWRKKFFKSVIKWTRQQTSSNENTAPPTGAGASSACRCVCDLPSETRKPTRAQHCLWAHKPGAPTPSTRRPLPLAPALCGQAAWRKAGRGEHTGWRLAHSWPCATLTCGSAALLLCT